MKRLSLNRVCSLIFFSALMMVAGCSSSSTSAPDNGTELLSVVAISRHGIRSPTSTLENMNLYTLRPEGFPNWSTLAGGTAGNLSYFGQQNAARLGSWYRDFYATQGLLPQRGSCPASGEVYVYADVAERTLHTAQGYLDGMFRSDSTPGCGIPVYQLNKNVVPKNVDPYIATAYSSFATTVDWSGDRAMFNAMAGGTPPKSLITAYSTQLQLLQAISGCCNPNACVPKKDPCTLLDLPNTQTTAGPAGYTSDALFSVANSLTESFELQYAQGMPDIACSTIPGAPCVGWGAIPTGAMLELTRLHVLSFDLGYKLPTMAKVSSTNLMWQLVGTMDQRVGKTVPGMLAPASSKFILFVAHDDNISAIATFLGGLTWQAEGFQRNDPGPAGALVFELHRVKQSGELIVRLFYVVATLEQMRQGTALSLATPPQRLPLPIPACGGLLDCPYDRFKAFINDTINHDVIVPPSFPQPEPS